MAYNEELPQHMKNLLFRITPIVVRLHRFFVDFTELTAKSEIENSNSEIRLFPFKGFNGNDVNADEPKAQY